MKISAVILTKNEENNIIDCIESVNFCDEIIIIDDYSTDRTEQIIKNLNNVKIKIYKRHLENDFSSQRNFGLSKASGEWVLYIDSDERVSPGLRGEIEQMRENGFSYEGFYLKRLDFMWGKKLEYGETATVRLLRFAKREKGSWKGSVHEVWNIRGKTKTLTFPLYHYPHPTVKEFIEEINHYSSLRAKELYKLGVTTNWFYIIVYPKAKFILNYFFRQGFRDGTPGFVFAMLMSLHSFLVRGKLYLLWHEK
jgi:glycosyltransferase involved in cell wall biosynthesis